VGEGSCTWSWVSEAAEPFLRGVVHHSPSLPSCLSVCQSICYLSSIYLSIYLSFINLSFIIIYYLSIYLCLCVSFCLCVSVSLCLCLSLSLSPLCPTEVFVRRSATPRTPCLKLTWSPALSLGATVKQRIGGERKARKEVGNHFFLDIRVSNVRLKGERLCQ